MGASDFIMKNFGSATLLWPGSTCPREYIHGLSAKASVLCSDALPTGFRRIAYLKPYNLYSSGHLMDTLPIAANFTITENSKQKSVHPIIDPTWGFAAYGLNIRGEYIDEDEISALPTATITKGPNMGTITVNNAISWWDSTQDATYGVLNVMPSSINTNNKIRGPMYNSLDSGFHVRYGEIDSAAISGNHIFTPGSPYQFPYFCMDEGYLDSNTFTGRDILTFKPSMFAVVQCVNCLCVGLRSCYARSNYNLSDSNRPRMGYDAGVTSRSAYVHYEWGGGQSDPRFDINQSAGDPNTNDDYILRSKQIYANTTGTSRVFFAWWETGGRNSINADPGLAMFHSLPVAAVVLPDDLPVGSEVYVRILQYGVEWNF